ncbi:MAG TPA: hypothetical protein VKY85_06430 [Candidatus Angelobacter sp.]|nr:hypothetical protein [Candidatus Angelobacter sp.]
MPNQSGNVYGLTILSPIIHDHKVDISHNCAIRTYLAELARRRKELQDPGPFATLSSTHIARLVVMDDVVYVGMPACEEHLKSPYLVFESNFDGDLDTYLDRMARDIPEAVDSVWSHCVGYPGLQDVARFKQYMKRCQLTTTFYFADVNDKTVQQTLRALQMQNALADFIEKNQGKPPAELQKAFAIFLNTQRPEPRPGMPGIGGMPCIETKMEWHSQ